MFWGSPGRWTDMLKHIGETVEECCKNLEFLGCEVENRQFCFGRVLDAGWLAFLIVVGDCVQIALPSLFNPILFTTFSLRKRAVSSPPSILLPKRPLGEFPPMLLSAP